MDQFRYIKIQPQTIDFSARLWGINTEFVGFIPQSLVISKLVYLVKFFFFVSQFPRDFDTIKTTLNIKVCPKSLGATSEY